jgi:hypothetical protein
LSLSSGAVDEYEICGWPKTEATCAAATDTRDDASPTMPTVRSDAGAAHAASTDAALLLRQVPLRRRERA